MKLKNKTLMSTQDAGEGYPDDALKKGFIINPPMPDDARGIGDNIRASYHADLNGKAGFSYEMSDDVYYFSSEDNNGIKTKGESIFQKSISTKNQGTGINSNEFDDVSGPIGNCAPSGASKAGQASTLSTGKKVFEIKNLNNKANFVAPVFFVIIVLFLLLIDCKVKKEKIIMLEVENGA